MKLTKPIKQDFVTYIGPSMNPTLKPGDRLHVIPFDDQETRPGDVIVFFSPEDGTKVTHRVIFVDSQGIRTRGDKNIQVDPWVLGPEAIIGRVVSTRRGNGQRIVFGGRLGRLYACVLRTLRGIDSWISPFLYPAYNWLARGGIFRRLLHAWVKTRVVSFDRPWGTELQLLTGGLAIGRWLPGKDHWQIRRPFRIFVDEASLPESPSKATHR